MIIPHLPDPRWVYQRRLALSLASITRLIISEPVTSLSILATGRHWLAAKPVSSWGGGGCGPSWWCAGGRRCRRWWSGGLGSRAAPAYPPQMWRNCWQLDIGRRGGRGGRREDERARGLLRMMEPTLFNNRLCIL